MDILNHLIEQYSVKKEHMENIVQLIDDGNTIPFIARYRKELTGGCDDQLLREIGDRLVYLRNLEKRKSEIFNAITEQGKMDSDIELSLKNATTLAESEDIYRPFKQKKRTRASIAKEKGLEPLANIILLQDDSNILSIAKGYINLEKGVDSEESAIAGAKDIIAEMVSDDANIRKKLRKLFINNGEISTKMINVDKEGASTYEMYKEYTEFVKEIKSHRILAINRGEKEDFLRVKIEFDKDIAVRIIGATYLKNKNLPFVKDAIEDSYTRLIMPSLEREIRTMLTESAGEQAIKMFEVNLKPLLMQPPLKDKIVMGFDPAYRTGCKIAVVDQTGKVLDKTVIYPTMPRNDVENSKKTLKSLIEKHNVSVIAIGNGTASKESEMFIADLIKELDRDLSYMVVNEAGASVYSASALGAEEFPEFDVSERSAVSIARRLQDPLSELIKIDPKSIGVGQYQHDMDKKRLDEVLGGVLEDCVNKVGVDLNTASYSLLRFVAGLNLGIAKSIIAYREKNGKFNSRSQITSIPRLGQKSFEQCAGFLRIIGGENIFDNTAVHPESYGSAKKLLNLFGFNESDIANGNLAKLPELIKIKGEKEVADICGLGGETLKDIVSELLKPGRDIRDGLPKPTLRRDILSIEDLKEGMVLDGTVRNVIDFGAFIDISVHQDGLVHISQITDRYIKHPSEVLKVGQAVKVKVMAVDVKKNRISLTMKDVK